MTELTNWAANGTPRAPTQEEIDGGFECGPADKDLFDWLFQQLALRSNLISLVGFYQSVEAIENDPPANPQAGDSWLIGAAPTGDWAGHTDKIAIWTGLEWITVTPKPRMLVGVRNGPDLRWRDDLSTPGWMPEISSIAYRSMI
ncbi:DUF2793 domain-containing protein [Roseibium alexandrii]|uniref:DUF2793 domain-containing protein n=1 Tax=Roseibium alexandrii TaxID=388408 RepID=UPI00374FFC32